MPKAKTAKYKVVRKGLDKHEIGDVIELTEEQAANRINKVVPVKAEKKAPAKKAAAKKAPAKKDAK